MPGGGIHQTQPGQVTDDSEMAMCLMLGIINGVGDDEEKVLNTDCIVQQYQKWIN